MSEKTDKWLRLADQDVPVVKSMLNGKYYSWVGFLCHLIVEKSLKAVISERTGQIPPKIHKLARLADQAGLYNELSETQLNLLKRLTPMHIEARYNEYKDAIGNSLTPEGWKNLISETEEFLCWIKTKLGK